MGFWDWILFFGGSIWVIALARGLFEIVAGWPMRPAILFALVGSSLILAAAVFRPGGLDVDVVAFAILEALSVVL